MGTVLFLILKFTDQVSTEFDWLILCILISIDTVGFLAYVNCKKKKG